VRLANLDYTMNSVVVMVIPIGSGDQLIELLVSVLPILTRTA